MLPIILLAAAAAIAPDHATRIDYLRNGLDKTLSNLETKAKRHGVSITTRDLTNGALAELILHGDGNRAANLTWDTATLDRYLTDPRGVVPGTKMTYAGLRDEQKRHDLIAYLETLK